MKLPWLQLAVLHGADPVIVAGQCGGGCTQLRPWGAVLLLTLLTCLWQGGKESSQGVRNPCEVLTSLGFAMPQSRGRLKSHQ